MKLSSFRCWGIEGGGIESPIGSVLCLPQEGLGGRGSRGECLWRLNAVLYCCQVCFLLVSLLIYPPSLPPSYPAAPVITMDPLSLTFAPAGFSATFIVVATGNNIGYQWQVNGTDIPTATSNTYTIVMVAVNDTGDYRCVVSNTLTNESVTSAAASLTVGKCVSAVVSYM